MTSEVAAASGNTGGELDWRISIATIGAAGPFSLFPGVTRTLAVLTGAGVTLTGASIGLVQLKPGSDPLRFSGDEPIYATPISGPTRDLNVMTRNAAFDHELRVLSPGVTALRAEGGPCCLVAAETAIACKHGDRSVLLNPFDAALFDDLVMVGLGESARAYAVHIRRLGGR